MSSFFATYGTKLRALSGVVDFGVRGQYACTTNAGALLYLWDQGHRTSCEPNEIWRRHILANFRFWEEFFAKCGIEKQGMVIVRGFVKTTSWDAITWIQSSDSYGAGASAGVPGRIGGGIFHSAARTSFMAPEHRSFPSRNLEDIREGLNLRLRDPPQGDYPREQTVFLSYYYIKRRKWFPPLPKLEANAGYHNLPSPPEPDSDIGSDAQILTETQGEEEVSSLLCCW